MEKEQKSETEENINKKTKSSEVPKNNKINHTLNFYKAEDNNFKKIF